VLDTWLKAAHEDKGKGVKPGDFYHAGIFAWNACRPARPSRASKSSIRPKAGPPLSINSGHDTANEWGRCSAPTLFGSSAGAQTGLQIRGADCRSAYPPHH
jgi:hypothetical protein